MNIRSGETGKGGITVKENPRERQETHAEDIACINNIRGALFSPSPGLTARFMGHAGQGEMPESLRRMRENVLEVVKPWRICYTLLSFA